MGIRTALFMAQQTARGVALVALERLESGVVFNPGSPKLRRDPYPTYARLLAHDPFHRTWVARGWVLFRYEDIIAVLRDARFSSDDRNQPSFARIRRLLQREGILTERDPQEPGLLRRDPPDHTRLRNLVNKAFTPRAVTALRPRIEAIVGELLDARAKSGRMEVIDDLAYPLPVTVIAEMLGIPVEDRARFKQWSDEVVRGLGTPRLDDIRRSNQAGRELRAYLEPIADARRREPREDLLSQLVIAEEQGDKLSAEEVFTTCLLLLVAGNETTTNLIGNGLLALLRQRDQWKALCEDPARVENAVEELLRYDSPVQLTSRIALEDVELSGHRIRKGQQVLVALGAANRDPARFPEPERLDIARKDVKHLSFGFGAHYCLGAPLARLEGQIALRALAERFPELRLAADDVEWGDNAILRGVKELPVVF